MANLEHDALIKRSSVERFSDALTSATGSMPFAVVHLGWFGIWVWLNSGLSRVVPFDPFPFSLLTLLVSLEAIFLTVFVLMSQNRMTHQADRRAHLDLQVDLLAERELTLILYLVKQLCHAQKIHIDGVQDQLRELLEETDVQEVASDLDSELPEE